MKKMSIEDKRENKKMKGYQKNHQNTGKKPNAGRLQTLKQQLYTALICNVTVR